jgi:mono/diheme cytochrome c family protein
LFKSIVAASLTLVLFCAASATTAQAAPAPDPVAVHAGQQVFLKNCFPCHSTAEGQQKVGPSLFHEMQGPHPKRSATEILGILHNGRKGAIGQMPSFKDILTKEDTDALLAYLHTI